MLEVVKSPVWTVNVPEGPICDGSVGQPVAGSVEVVVTGIVVVGAVVVVGACVVVGASVVVVSGTVVVVGSVAVVVTSTVVVVASVVVVANTSASNAATRASNSVNSS
jgi:hypothetical protein